MGGEGFLRVVCKVLWVVGCERLVGGHPGVGWRFITGGGKLYPLPGCFLQLHQKREGPLQRNGFSEPFSRPSLCSRFFPLRTKCLGIVFNCWSMACFGLFWWLRGWSSNTGAQRSDAPIALKKSTPLTVALLVGGVLTLGASASILQFSSQTAAAIDLPVQGEEVVPGLYKFDFPFLADKRVWEKTINTFKAEHPELKVNYIYTGPDELNSKKKTHVLVYVFTESR